MSLLAVQQLHKRLGGTEILKGVSLELHPGQIIALVGPSGAGKSTLLRCLNLLEMPDQGRLLWREQPVDYRRLNGKPLSQFRRRLGMVFQHFHLFPHFTVLENVMEGPTQVLGWSRQRAQERARQLLSRVGLEGYGERRPHQLSGGQKQRVAIARALALEPEALLLDEVTSALDVESAAEVQRLLQELAASMPMIVVTHDLAFARSVANHCCFMEDGRMLESGATDQVLDSPLSARARRFLSAGAGEQAMPQRNSP